MHHQLHEQLWYGLFVTTKVLGVPQLLATVWLQLVLPAFDCVRQVDVLVPDFHHDRADRRVCVQRGFAVIEFDLDLVVDDKLDAS
eukprot:627812-Prymnesium_polylepis.1